MRESESEKNSNHSLPLHSKTKPNYKPCNMKFGKTLREKVLKEWRFYALDYAGLKEILKNEASQAEIEAEFLALVDEQKVKLQKFWAEKVSLWRVSE